MVTGTSRRRGTRLNGVFKLDPTLHIYELAAKVPDRPILTGVQLRPDGTAWASDGFVGGVIKGKFEADEDSGDQPVIVPAKFIQNAFKARPRHMQDVWLHIKPDGTVLTMGGDEQVSTRVIDGTFPNFSQLFASSIVGYRDSEAVKHVAFNVKYLPRISKALNLLEIAHPYFTGASTPLLFAPSHQQGMALLMPMFVGLETAEVIADKAFRTFGIEVPAATIESGDQHCQDCGKLIAWVTGEPLKCGKCLSATHEVQEEEINE